MYQLQRKKNPYRFVYAILAGVALFLSSCDKKTDDDDDTKFRNILTAYTDNTVIPTYRGMADGALEMLDVCEQMSFPVTQASVNSACEKWRAARLFWEQSEAFLFGPAEYNSLDPHLDSWPLDKNKLDQLLARPDVLSMDAAYARNNLGSSLLGFHAIEYVLFRDGNPRSATDISREEMTYLKAIARVLAEDCILLEGGWRGETNLSATKKEVLSSAGLSISANFGYEMKNAGKSGSRYTATMQAIEEIIEGCKDIADEVGNSKIADPVESGNVLDVESWYSWNSINDFVNNIVGIQNAYYGSRNGVDEHSLSRLVAQKNPTLDSEIKANIENAKTKIRAIGEPFRNHLNNTAGAQAAITACDQLVYSLNKIYAEL